MHSPPARKVRKIMRQHFQNLVDEEEATIDMTPMLDVVFIMLIFFIVTASFVKEAGIDVNRPEAATAVKKDRANILVAISDTGEIWINKRRVDARAVQANIERLHAERGELPGAVPYGTFVLEFITICMLCRSSASTHVYCGL